MKPLMITFSGIDSSGKSTYIELLRRYFDEENIRYKIVWSRGGYTNGFENLKKIARLIAREKLPKSGNSEKRDSLFQKKSVSSLWYILGMLDLIRLYAITFRIYNLLGYTLICDRYFWDTYVDFYIQFSEEKINGSKLFNILQKVMRKPDISIFLYISAKESLKRSIVKNEAFSESLEQRTERNNIYHKLKNKKVWDTTISTENTNIADVWNTIKGLIKYGLL